MKSYIQQGFASGDFSFCYIDRYHDYSDPAATYGALLVNLNCHASVALTPIKEGKLSHLIDQSGYTHHETLQGANGATVAEWKDDDYCEWAYWIDFHRRTVEIIGYNICATVTFDTLLSDSQWMGKVRKAS